MKILVLPLVAIVLFFGVVSTAHAFPSALPAPIPKSLVVGSHGKRVKALQWLMSGHNPSHYRSLKPYRGAIDGRFGRKTGIAVWNMKYMLGYPIKYVNKAAGFELFQILKGKEARPIQWIAIAAKRQARIKHAIYRITSCEERIAATAISQIGIVEEPGGGRWNTNRGPGISYPTARTHPSFQSITGAYGAAWCASFSQWVLYKTGVGPVADRSAGVFYIRDWAYRRGLLHSRPEKGNLVLFLWSSGHMGVVVKVVQTGYYTVEGNTSNGVYERYYPFSLSAIAFVYLPGCST